MPNKRSRVVVAFLGAAAAGLLIFGFLSWRATTVERVTVDQALYRFETLRTSRGAASPILEIAADGAVARRRRPPERVPGPPLKRLHVLVYHPRSQRLAESRIPFWFFRLKAPAAQYALEGTGSG